MPVWTGGASLEFWSGVSKLRTLMCGWMDSGCVEVCCTVPPLFCFFDVAAVVEVYPKVVHGAGVAEVCCTAVPHIVASSVVA